MNNSVIWTGNRVLDPHGARPTAQTSTSAVPASTNRTTVATITPAPMTQQGPPPVTDPGFIPYYLTSNIGKSVRAEFVVGGNQFVDKSGILSEVGINYFVLSDPSARTDTMCDLYSVKFVTILRG